MGSASKGGRTERGRWRSLLPTLALGAVAPSWAGCEGNFDGPYACLAGFASCDSSQDCATDILHDAANCGGCGMACPVGATCTNGVCGGAGMGAGATTVFDFNNAGYVPSGLAVNSTAIFWLDTQNPQTLYENLVTGGSPQPLLESASGEPDVAGPTLACSGYTVDDQYVYFVGNFPTTSSLASSIGLGKLSLADRSITQIAAVSSQTSGSGCPQAMGLSGGYLYAFVSQPGSGIAAQAFRVPLGGGTVTTVANVPGNSNDVTQFFVEGQELVFEVSGNGPPQLALLPVVGGPVTMQSVDLPDQGFGFEAFTADATNVYAAGTSCPCNDDNGNYDGPPMGGVGAVPLGGGTTAQLGTITGYVGAMAVDATNVYVLTDATLWAVPMAGGSAMAIAGNLASGTGAVGCASSSCSSGNNSGNNSGLPQPGDVVASANAVYFVDRSPSVRSLLSVPK